MFVALLIAALALVVWAWWSTRRPAWSPHGPRMLPWVGNMMSLDFARPDITYAKWSKEYGNMFHVKMGAMQQVVLSSPELIREAFSRQEVAGRPDTEMFTFLVNGTGLSSSNGELWRESRRFTLHHLRNMGMGKSNMEDFIHRQIANFMDEVIKPGCRTEITLDAPLNIAIVNIIWKLVASEELDLADEKIQSIITRFAQLGESFTALAIFDVAPWLSPILSRFVIDKQKIEADFTKLMEEEFLPCIQRHKDNLDVNSEPRDYMDAMLQEQRKRPELMTDWHLLMSMLDLFTAGNDTTATTLRWAFCFLCSRPECQRRLQAELDAVVGRQRLPSLADRSHLPYTEAVILETQRLGDIAPMLLPHQTLAPVTVGGHRLPAGVQVIANIQAVHRSQRYFEEPNQFRPERFLDADGQFRPDKNVMPFSVGKRVCLGESLARSELFLFLTVILQKYSFRWEGGSQRDVVEDPNFNFLRCPAPFKLVPEVR